MICVHNVSEILIDRWSYTERFGAIFMALLEYIKLYPTSAGASEDVTSEPRDVPCTFVRVRVFFCVFFFAAAETALVKR